MSKRTRHAPPLPIALLALAIGILALFNMKTITRVIGPPFKAWLQSTSHDISEAGKKKPKQRAESRSRATSGDEYDAGQGD